MITALLRQKVCIQLKSREFFLIMNVEGLIARPAH